MNRKLCAIVLIITIVLIGLVTVTNAKPVTKKTVKNILFNDLNKQIYLGQATIWGNGTSEENTTVDVDAEIDLSIGIDSETEIVDFYITYSITCNGEYDDGRVYFLLQINGVSQDLINASTNESDSGNLILKDVEVKRGDKLTFELGAVYTNLIPPFVVPDIDVGGGLINKATIFNKFCNRFPLMSRLLQLPVFEKLMYLQ